MSIQQLTVPVGSTALGMDRWHHCPQLILNMSWQTQTSIEGYLSNLQACRGSAICPSAKPKAPVSYIAVPHDGNATCLACRSS